MAVPPPQGARSLDTLAACDPSTLTHSAVRLLHLLLRNPFNAFPGADASEAACETMEAVHAAQDEGMVDKLSVEGASSQPASNSHQEKGSACWGTLFCMLTCKMSVLHVKVVALTLRDAKLHVMTLYMLTCIRDVMHVNMHCCVCQHA